MTFLGDVDASSLTSFQWLDLGEIALERVSYSYPPTRMILRTFAIPQQHRVVFTHGVFDASNHALRDLIAEGAGLDGSGRVLVCIDQGLLEMAPGLPGKITEYGNAHASVMELVGSPLCLPGGEACKNDWSRVEKLWEAFHFHALCRHSYVVVIGGGAFLDLVGFAAATAHRGIRLIRMPTTTLSQGDGGVGVKNGVNYFGKKNWVGTFAVPFAVVNDLEFLRLLPDRTCRDGIVEAIKVALIRDRDFFHYIERHTAELARLETEALERVIRRSAELHVDHISLGGDPFEQGSARPLDFGHWAAHKLEQISGFTVSHGEAVSIGMALDLCYSARIGLIDAAIKDRILGVLEAVGLPLWSDFLDAAVPGGTKPMVLQGVEEFREHLGGRLTITLVPRIGSKREVHEMDEKEILLALDELRCRNRLAKGASAKSKG